MEHVSIGMTSSFDFMDILRLTSILGVDQETN